MTLCGVLVLSHLAEGLAVKDVKFLCSCEAVKWLKIGYECRIWRRPIASTIFRNRYVTMLTCDARPPAPPI